MKKTNDDFKREYRAKEDYELLLWKLGEMDSAFAKNLNSRVVSKKLYVEKMESVIHLTLSEFPDKCEDLKDVFTQFFHFCASKEEVQDVFQGHYRDYLDKRYGIGEYESLPYDVSELSPKSLALCEEFARDCFGELCMLISSPDTTEFIKGIDEVKVLAEELCASGDSYIDRMDYLLDYIQYSCTDGGLLLYTCFSNYDEFSAIVSGKFKRCMLDIAYAITQAEDASDLTDMTEQELEWCDYIAKKHFDALCAHKRITPPDSPADDEVKQTYVEKTDCLLQHISKESEKVIIAKRLVNHALKMDNFRFTIVEWKVILLGYYENCLKRKIHFQFQKLGPDGIAQIKEQAESTVRTVVEQKYEQLAERITMHCRFRCMKIPDFLTHPDMTESYITRADTAIEYARRGFSDNGALLKHILVRDLRLADHIVDEIMLGNFRQLLAEWSDACFLDLLFADDE